MLNVFNHMVFVFLAAIMVLSRVAFAAPASGKINNKDFTFVSGIAKKNGGNYQITLWTEGYLDPCKRFGGSTLDVRMIFPAQVGKYKIDAGSWDQNVILMGDGTNPGSPENNIVANVGGLEITAISDTEVKGTMSASLDWMKSKVAGDFSVQLCP